MSKIKPYSLILGLILLLAAALRLWGLTWALPGATHYFSYHPDESRVLQVVMGMDLWHKKLLPHFYNYGSLQLYLVLFCNTIFFGGGRAGSVTQLADMLLVGRIITMMMALGTVWATAALGTRLWGARAGLCAALLLAIMPLHAQHSHWLTVDVPATFWMVLSLLQTARLVKHNEPRPFIAALWAGVFAGFAAATKYNVVLALFPALLMGVLRPPGGRLRVVLTSVAACLAAFIAACPGVVLESGKWLADVRFESLHVRTQPGATFSETGNGFVYVIAHNLAAGLGLPLLCMSLVSVVYALWRRQRGDGLLAAFAFPYYIMIGIVAVRYARYTIPLLPILALWSGRIVSDILILKQSILRNTVIAACACGAIFTLYSAVLLIRPMTEVDPRDQAEAWFQGHAPAPATIGFAAMPWFQAPPLSPYFSLPGPGEMVKYLNANERARFVYFNKEWDLRTLEVCPLFVELSEYDYSDALRLGNPGALLYLSTLNRDYSLVRVFSTRKSARLMRPSELPHDMLYTSPEIWIYQRKL